MRVGMHLQKYSTYQENAETKLVDICAAGNVNVDYEYVDTGQPHGVIAKERLGRMSGM